MEEDAIGGPGKRRLQQASHLGTLKLVIPTVSVHAKAQVLQCRWNSSVAGTFDHPNVGDEELVAGLRKSQYSSLQSGWLPATPDHRAVSKVFTRTWQPCESTRVPGGPSVHA